LIKLLWLADPTELPSYHFGYTKWSDHPSKHFLALELTFVLFSLLLDPCSCLLALRSVQLVPLCPVRTAGQCSFCSPWTSHQCSWSTTNPAHPDLRAAAAEHVWLFVWDLVECERCGL